MALGVEERVQVRRVVQAGAAEHHQVVTAGHDVDGVELQQTDTPDNVQQSLPVWRFRAAVQALLHHSQGPGRF
jgi:hypothetical protein